MKNFAGIDFGTTNSSIAINTDGQIKLIDLDTDNDGNPIQILKSVLFFSNEFRQISFGQQAITRFVEESNNGRFMRSIKSLLPTKIEVRTSAIGKTYQIEDLIALILSEIKRRAEKASQSEISKIVLGRPVIFSEDPELDKLAENRLLDAAKKANFQEVTLMFEPVAAALKLESTMKPHEEKIVLVGDFGGGTSDFTLINLHGGQKKVDHDRKEDILAVNGLYLGGDTFDSLLMWNSIAKYFGKNAKFRPPASSKELSLPLHIIQKLRNWHLLPQLRNVEVRSFLREIKLNSDSPKEIQNLTSLIDDNLGILLFQTIEEAKSILTFKNSTTIEFDEIIGVIITEQITRTIFESIIQEKLNDLRQCILQLLIEANLSPSDIDIVSLTGGTSQIPAIRKLFINLFGEEKIKNQNLFTSVSEGLASNSQSLNI